MKAERAYKWGAAFFGIVAVAGLAAMPYALRCCSSFSSEELALREQTGWETTGPAITAALMDWPLGFRLFLMMIVVALICTLAMTAMAVIAHREQQPETTSSIPGWIAVRVLLSSVVVAVLYILATYTIGFFGMSRGPHNLVWLLGIPVLVAWMGKPNLRGLAFGFPLALTGFACLAIISLTLDIPLD
jgi:heme/copper-type cytochrome/quinol oxidase subunit 2